MAEEWGPRIPAVQDVGPELAEVLAAARLDPSGRPLNIFLTMAHHPALLQRWNLMAALFRRPGRLPVRDRELVVLRTAWRTRASYEWGQHVLIARDVGVTDDEIVRVSREDLADWPDRERSLLRFADELLREVDVSDEVWAPATRLLDEAQLIELVMLIGLYRMAAGFLNTLRVVPEPYLPGWPTDAARS